MLFSLGVAIGLLNSFRMFSITIKSHVVNSYNCFSSNGNLCHPIPHFQKKIVDSFAILYQCWVGIIFQTYQLELVLDLLKKFATNLILILESKQGWLLVGCGRYRLNIEINIALILNWYYFKSLPGRYWYKSGITSSHTSLVSSFIPWIVPTSLYTKQETLVATQH
jgi:hypothetical protein